MPLVDQDEVVEALAPQGPDHPLRSAIALGARTGVRMVVMPMPAARATKSPPQQRSRSRIRKRGWWPQAVASMRCCQTQAAVEGGAAYPSSDPNAAPTFSRCASFVTSVKTSWKFGCVTPLSMKV